jgi:hypothetical protein
LACRLSNHLLHALSLASTSPPSAASTTCSELLCDGSCAVPVCVCVCVSCFASRPRPPPS